MEVSFERQFTLKTKCVGSFESEGYLDLKAWSQLFVGLKADRFFFYPRERYKTEMLLLIRTDI